MKQIPAPQLESFSIAKNPSNKAETFTFHWFLTVDNKQKVKIGLTKMRTSQVFA